MTNALGSGSAPILEKSTLHGGSSPPAEIAPFAIEQLSDAELIAGVRGLVARSNHQLARLLAHLGAVEARGLYRACACASLATYCVYELRLSEDMAFRYAKAARLSREFPTLLESLSRGELHLTGLLLLGPHLTEENCREVLRAAKHRSKREILALVRRLDPLPEIPARIEPLGPARAELVLANPSWSAFMHAQNPERELTPEERPSGWLNLGAAEGEDAVPHRSSNFCEAEAAHGAAAKDFAAAEGCGATIPLQRYAVQFTANQEYVDLLERARDLLEHAVPRRSIEEVHLRALRLLVTDLEKRKFALGREPRRRVAAQGPVDSGTTARAQAELGVKQQAPVEARTREAGNREAATGEASNGEAVTGEMVTGEPSSGEPSSGEASSGEPSSGEASSGEANRVEPGRVSAAYAPRQRPSSARDHGADGSGSPLPTRERDSAPGAPDVCADVPRRCGGELAEKRSGRHIPAQVRRAVHERDAGRCAYVAADGQRCRETRLLEFHHLEPYGRGGGHYVDNLSLRCRAHNALAAEHDFGRSYVSRRAGRAIGRQDPCASSRNC